MTRAAKLINVSSSQNLEVEMLLKIKHMSTTLFWLQQQRIENWILVSSLQLYITIDQITSNVPRK